MKKGVLQLVFGQKLLEEIKFSLSLPEHPLITAIEVF